MHILAYNIYYLFSGSGNASYCKPITNASERIFNLDDLPDYLKLTPDIKK